MQLISSSQSFSSLFSQSTTIHPPPHPKWLNLSTSAPPRTNLHSLPATPAVATKPPMSTTKESARQWTASIAVSVGQKTCYRLHGAFPVTLAETAAAVPFLSMAAFRLRHAPALFSESRFAEPDLSEGCWPSSVCLLQVPSGAFNLSVPWTVFTFFPMRLFISMINGTENLNVSRKYTVQDCTFLRTCSTISQKQ